MDVPCITIHKKQGGKMNKKVLFIVSQAIIASLYVVLTVIVGPFSYMAIQLRFSEILILLCFYKKDYIVGLSIGCFIANLFSPMLIYDITLGLLATILILICIYKSKNLYIAIIFPVLFNGLLVGLELMLAYQLPYFISALEVACGELIVMIFGVIVFKILDFDILERLGKFLKGKYDKFMNHLYVL